MLENLLLRQDEHGVYRVGKLGVILDGVIYGMRESQSAAEIQSDYPSLTLAEVQAAMTFCRDNPDEIENYVKRQEVVWSRLRAHCDANPSPVVERLRALKSTVEQATR